MVAGAPLITGDRLAASTRIVNGASVARAAPSHARLALPGEAQKTIAAAKESLDLLVATFQ